MSLRPRGAMDSASDFESGGCGFDPHRGCSFFITLIFKMQTEKYIVHSYEVYTAPESLEDRLPYLDPPFTSDINPH